jgi:glycosyltransferase involved in cell wall biosynthesis
MAFELIKELRNDESISCTAIVLNEGTLSANLNGIGVKTHMLSEKKMSSFQILFRIRKIVRENGINVIHSHRYKENFLAYFASLPYTDIRLISTQHGMPETTNSLKSRILRQMNFFILAYFFTFTVPVSKEIQDTLLRKNGFNKSRVAVIHNGVFLPAITRDHRNSSSYIIGSAGRFVPIKNYPLFIKIAYLCKKEPGIHFNLAGDGPDHLLLENLVRAKSLESTFKFCGHTPTMQGFYQEIDVFVNTSLHEGIPMSILEAMAYGIPVIAPRIGGIPEIIEDGIDGFLIRPDNAELFAEKCLLLCQDTELRKKIGAAARQKISSFFSIRICAQRYSALYCLDKNTGC